MSEKNLQAGTLVKCKVTARRGIDLEALASCDI
ncbi:MAG: hypothetical protein FWC17_05030 [Treponema sp.]|nr:hypothetical protein [Treponema sp.]